MAADLRFEQQLRGALRAALGDVEGPHPAWSDAPVAAIIATDFGRPGGRIRRPSRALVLLAAVLAIAVVGVALVAGGAFRTEPGPLPAPSHAIVLPAVEPSPTASSSNPDLAAASPIVEPSASPCLTRWTHTGTYPPGGLMDGSFLWRLDGSEGELYLEFLNSIDTVKEITIEPISPPFKDGAGRTVPVAGTEQFKLTIRGLTRATEMARDDMKPGDGAHGPGVATVQAPIAEARRIRKPKQVLGAPSQTEVWIVGVDVPSCLSVRTAQGFYEQPQPGNNVILVTFEPRSP